MARGTTYFGGPFTNPNPCSVDVLEFQMFVKLKSCHLLNRTKNTCVKHALLFEGPSSPLSTEVDIDVTNVINGTRPSPSIFTFCRRSKTGQWEGLGMRLGFPATGSFFFTFGVILYMWMRRKVDFMSICSACIEDYKDWWLMVVITGSSNQEPWVQDCWLTGGLNQEPRVQDCWLFISTHNNVWYSKASVSY